MPVLMDHVKARSAAPARIKVSREAAHHRFGRHLTDPVVL